MGWQLSRMHAKLPSHLTKRDRWAFPYYMGRGLRMLMGIEALREVGTLELPSWPAGRGNMAA